MLIILNKDHFNQVMELAAKDGMAHHLLEQLFYLHTWSDDGFGSRCRCLLVPDGDVKQRSFGFRIQKLRVEAEWHKAEALGKHRLEASIDSLIAGGLIFDPNVKNPENPWSVHT